MKYKILIPFLLLCITTVFSQAPKDKIIYFDSLYNPAAETNYNYKRIVKDYYVEQKMYEVYEYYNSGSINFIGITTNKDKLAFTGMSKAYYKNGNRKNICNYYYINPSPKIYEWYENGEKKSEIEHYVKTARNEIYIRVINFWDINNIQKIINGNGSFEMEDENSIRKGSYIDGYQHGTWIGTDKKHNVTYSENYKKGRLISGKSIDSNNIEHQYKKLIKIPEPKEGNKKFFKSINNFLKNHLAKEDINKCYIKLYINIDGALEVKSIVGIDSDNKEKLLEILNKCKEWNPAIERGMNIPFTLRYSFPFSSLSIGINNIH